MALGGRLGSKAGEGGLALWYHYMMDCRSLSSTFDRSQLSGRNEQSDGDGDDDRSGGWEGAALPRSSPLL